MKKYKDIVLLKDQGKIVIKLAELLEQRNMTRSELSRRIGIKFDTINRYYRSKNVVQADLDFLAKVCYALDCSIEDLLEYQCKK